MTRCQKPRPASHFCAATALGAKQPHDLLAPMALSDREDRVRDKAAKLIESESADAIWTMLRTGGRAADIAVRMAG